MSAPQAPRWQASTDRLMRRWCGTTVGLQRFPAMLPMVIPTVVIGRDYPDQERALFTLGFSNVSGMEIQAHEDTELVAVWASNNGALLQLAANLIVLSAAQLALPINLMEQSGNGVPPARVSNAVVSGPRIFMAPNNTTLFLPYGGMILEAGRGLEIGPDSVGPTIDCGCVIRRAAPLQ